MKPDFAKSIFGFSVFIWTCAGIVTLAQMILSLFFDARQVYYYTTEYSCKTLTTGKLSCGLWQEQKYFIEIFNTIWLILLCFIWVEMILTWVKRSKLTQYSYWQRYNRVRVRIPFILCLYAFVTVIALLWRNFAYDWAESLGRALGWLVSD